MLECFLTTDDAKWYNARNMLLDRDVFKDNGGPDVKLLYKLAKENKHPDAIWLCNVLEKYFDQTFAIRVEGYDWQRYRCPLERVFELEYPDARAICFRYLLRSPFVRTAEFFVGLQQSVSYPLSRLLVGLETRNKEMIQSAIDDDEPFAIGLMSKNFGARFIKNGADNANVDCCIEYMFEVKRKRGYCPEMFHYIGMAASTQKPRPMNLFASEVTEYRRQNPGTLLSGSCFYKIGWLAHIFKQNEIRFTGSTTVMLHFRHVSTCARKMYLLNVRYTREAVNTWLLIAKRKGKFVNRDVRRMIGMTIWNTRMEGLYEYEIN